MDAHEGVPLEGNPYRPPSPLTEDERKDLVLHSRVLVFRDDVERRLRVQFCQLAEAMSDEDRQRCAHGIIKANFLLSLLPTLPEGVWKCPNLASLECNELQSVSPKIGRLTKLRWLEPFMYAPCGIRWLPYEIHHTSVFTPELQEDTLAAMADLPRLPDFPTGPPTLQELAGRMLLSRNLVSLGGEDNKPASILPAALWDYLRAAKQCSICSGPYWDSVYATWAQGLTTEPFLALCCSLACLRQVKHALASN